MPKPWVASLGNLKGWLIAAGLWTLVLVGYYGVQASKWSHSRVFLDPSLGKVMRCEVPVQTVIGEFTEPGDAADDYELAVQECNASQRYSGYWALAEGKPLSDPDQLDIRAPQYLLSGAKKAKMGYTGRYAQRADWTAAKVPHVKAFDAIGQACIIKADLLARTGKSGEAEALLKGVISLGYHLEQERVRLSQALTGLSLGKNASRRLARLYTDAGQEGRAWTAQRYADALQQLQERLEAKASTTTARLADASPLTAEMFWLVDNDKDRMWRIEATLRLGLTQWTAPRAPDRTASRDSLTHLAKDPDGFVREAAEAALDIKPEDVRKVR